MNDPRRPSRSAHDSGDSTAPRRRATKRRLSRWALPLAVTAALGSGLPAHADPVACLTVSYRLFGGSEHDVVDDCWVASPWTPIADEDDSSGNPALLEISYFYSIALPV